jgi:hypothetical protein
MRRLAPALILVLAACRGEGSDPKCAQARDLYVAHQVEAVDRAIAATPSPQQRNLLATQAREEVNKADRQFLAACEEMDSGKLLACLRTAQSMNDPDCEPVAAELKRRMTP